MLHPRSPHRLWWPLCLVRRILLGLHTLNLAWLAWRLWEHEVEVRPAGLGGCSSPSSQWEQLRHGNRRHQALEHPVADSRFLRQSPWGVHSPWPGAWWRS